MVKSSSLILFFILVFSAPSYALNFPFEVQYIDGSKNFLCEGVSCDGIAPYPCDSPSGWCQGLTISSLPAYCAAVECSFDNIAPISMVSCYDLPGGVSPVSWPSDFSCPVVDIYSVHDCGFPTSFPGPYFLASTGIIHWYTESSVTCDFVDGTSETHSTCSDAKYAVGIVCSDQSPALGCTEAGACNYDPDAIYDDGTCYFGTAYECAHQGCTEDQQVGCTDVQAENYSNCAITDDGSCTYSSEFAQGCTDPDAYNYDPAALYDDGSCLFPCVDTPENISLFFVNSSDYFYCTCLDPGAINYSPEPGLCPNLPESAPCFELPPSGEGEGEGIYMLGAVDNGTCAPSCTSATADFSSLDDLKSLVFSRFPFSIFAFVSDFFDYDISSSSSVEIPVPAYISNVGYLSVTFIDLAPIRLLLFVSLFFAVARHILRRIL